MAFQEVHVSQFTSPTTCYTGCRSGAGFFATETHSFSYQDENMTVTTESLSGSSPKLCVGHDQSGAWELFSFLDPSLIQEEQVEAPHRRRSVSTSSLPELESIDTTPIAWMTLKSREKLAPTYTASLTYRPLTPCLMTHQEERQVLVWGGSADDSKPRCFVVDQNQTLRPVELDGSAFSFDSPIMVMDSLTQENGCLLAVGCQDGTVRVITFDYQRTGDSLSFSHLESHTVTVDGPIMALNISHQNGKTNLVVGSMCGFVCRLQQVEENWTGPLMVAEGLCDSEDAVLAVHMFDNMVAFGTHSGRVYVCEQRQDDSYRQLWTCQLPYSIHGLAHVPKTSPTLLVTTRHTFHVFSRNCPKYSVSTAKRQLEELMSLRNSQINA
jgi:hypothetical protein